MTPTIDIVFNLLVFFLLAPMAAADEGYLTTNLPRAGPNPTGWQVDEPVCFYLETHGPDDEGVPIALGDGRGLGSDFRALGLALRDFRTRGLAVEVPVRLVPGAKVQHGWVVRVFDEVVAAGFERIEFTVPRPKRRGAGPAAWAY